ncbi:hypothetical protein [Actinomadura nitritigenes]|uniref:amino acid kinase family protein n=1 Tax=Actinomadura nitritigenes TaxID=134602 RepID=UPI003D933E1A
MRTQPARFLTAEQDVRAAEVITVPGGERLKADTLMLLTDVPAVMRDHGTVNARPVSTITPDRLRAMDLPHGSMGPKAEAACRFAGHRPGAAAVIGSLADAPALLAGGAGTRIEAP